MKTLLTLVLSGIAVYAAPCIPGTLQDYLDLTPAGCDVGLVQFTNFSLAPGQSIATPIDPALIQVTPGGTTSSPNLLFTINAAAAAGEVLESFFRFNALAALLSGGMISLNSPVVTGDGAVTGVLDICMAGDFLPGLPFECSGIPATAIVFATADDALLSASATGQFASFFDVFVDLTVDGGPSGSATLDAASITITAVPEPSAVLLSVTGLLLIGATRRASVS